MPVAALSSPHVVQLYDVVRTAHLERIQHDPRVTLLYQHRRYDFDSELAQGVDLQRAGTVGAFWYGLRHRIDVLEINEPLIATAAPRTLAAVAGSRVRSLVTRERPRVVCYAIENLDPRVVLPHLPWRARVKFRVQSLLIPMVWSQLSSIAFGTEQARELYVHRFGRQRHQAEARLFPALPTASASLPLTGRQPVVTFLGDLSDRKGFPLLLRAWPRVSRAIPDARFTIIGKGRYASDAEQLAEQDGRVTVHIDPPRATIFEELRASKVLVLPSQQTPLWREQVGLPIVEGLAQGCLVVTTDCTGLAPWLQEHGHFVQGDPESDDQLVENIVAALRSTRSVSDVLNDLPTVDGRAAAMTWLVER